MNYVVRRWHQEFPKWGHAIGYHDDDSPWCKATAVQGAFDALHADGESPDILVIADADVWAEDVHNAVFRVQSGARWAIPHFKVHRLTETASDAVLAGGPLEGETEERPYKGVIGGGMVVIERELYEEAPFDPRFQSWGQEDQSAGLAWATLAGKAWRSEKPLYHLYHEPQKRQSRVTGSQESANLYGKYRRALGDERKMRHLIKGGQQP